MINSIVFTFDLWFAVGVLLLIAFLDSKVYVGNGRVKILFRLLKALFTARIAELAVGFTPGETGILTLCIAIFLYLVEIRQDLLEHRVEHERIRAEH